MKFYDAGTIILIVFVSVCAIGGYVSKHWAGEDDAIIEEFCEERIEEVTGYNIDLSPLTQEKS